jgi:hypothetical protein
LTHEGEEAARRCDEDVEASSKRVDRRLLPNAAKTDGEAQLGSLRVGHEAVLHLGGQLSGGREDQHAGWAGAKSVELRRMPRNRVMRPTLMQRENGLPAQRHQPRYCVRLRVNPQ